MKRFVGQVAVVTGAGSGIGRALALALSSEGAGLALVGRDERKLAAVAQEMEGIVRCMPGDVGADPDVARIAQEVERQFGRVDILIHSAGAFQMGSVESLPVAELDALYRTNLRGPYALTRALLPLIKASQGQIVFINSRAGLATGPNWGAYSATKAALKMLADSLRAEVEGCGIRVLSVYPGRTATPMQERVHQMEGKTYRPEQLLRPEDVAAVVLNALALSGPAEVTDVVMRPTGK